MHRICLTKIQLHVYGHRKKHKGTLAAKSDFMNASAMQLELCAPLKSFVEVLFPRTLEYHLIWK